MSDTRGTAWRSNGPHTGAAGRRKSARALEDAAPEGATVLLLGLAELHDDCWGVLVDGGIRLERSANVAAALSALNARAIPVVIVGAGLGQSLMRAVRGRPELGSVHVVLAAPVDSPKELRTALDVGADDVMRVPFAPEVLVARVVAGLRAARLRANDALLRSMVANIPGALYHGAHDRDWTMHWMSGQVETITGYPASDFIDNSVRTFASVIHPDDRAYVERSVTEAVDARRPFNLEYRIARRDGEVRWVLERGQAEDGRDGRRLHGAIFDITVRRAAEEALREREVVRAQLAEVRASRARIVDAADRARREIERNLHDGAQQRFVSATLQLQLWRASRRELSDKARAELDEVLTELRTGLAELRELAHGLHPAVLSDRGLEGALASLADHASVPVQVRVELPERRLAMPVEAAAYYTVSEALTNVAKYARATRAWIDVDQREGYLGIEVGDDGTGGADLRPGCGLQGLRDRIAAINGTLTIDSQPGAGTILRARLPIA